MINRNNLFSIFVIPILLFSSVSCSLINSNEQPAETVFEFDFRESAHGWEPFFTNYPKGWSEKMELTFAYKSLPTPLDSTEKALFISAINHSDDVSMLFRRQIEGLDANTTYSVEYMIEFASEVPSNCYGVGGSPGESVTLIANSGNMRPERILESDSEEYFVLNIQHEEDPINWLENSIIGNIANSRECEQGLEFELKEIKTSPDHEKITTDDEGKVWLLFGTRSGFEGQTNLYYTHFKARFINLL